MALPINGAKIWGSMNSVPNVPLIDLNDSQERQATAAVKTPNWEEN
jgi:hypothetical protein